GAAAALAALAEGVALDVVDPPRAPAAGRDLDRLALADGVAAGDAQELRSAGRVLGRAHLGAGGVEGRRALEGGGGAQPRGPAPARLARQGQPQAALEDAEPGLLRVAPRSAARGHLLARELRAIV